MCTSFVCFVTDQLIYDILCIGFFPLLPLPLSFTATHTFPYIKKRIEVMSGGRREIELSPIEVAIDEIQTKVIRLRETVSCPVPDIKKLQLGLQGSVSAQVGMIS